MSSHKYKCPNCGAPMWKHGTLFYKTINKTFVRYKCSNCECKATYNEIALDRFSGTTQYCEHCKQPILATRVLKY